MSSVATGSASSPMMPTGRLRGLSIDSETGDSQHCLVCYSDLDYTTVAPCNHNEICPKCLLRLRFLHDDKKCPICKAENEQVVVDRKSDKTFSEYPIWGNELGSDFIFREDVGMFFPINYFDREIQPLFGYPCTFPKCTFDGSFPATYMEGDGNSNNNNNKSESTPSSKIALRALQDHLRNKHRLVLCGLCTDHPRDFVARLPRFTPTQLKDHFNKGDGADSGFHGHPLCEFCRPKRFYDLTELHKHLTKDHYKCHVCERKGLHNQFFRDYQALEKHFDRQHFLCHHQQCLEARFMVFANEIDLADHERSVHGTSSGDTKIQLEFRVRRSTTAPENQHVPDENDFNFGLDGEAFVPAALPVSRDGELSLHPRHVERTAELRQHAASLRDSSFPNQEAFPTLQNTTDESTAAQQALRMGWTDGVSIRRVAKAKPSGKVTDEDFPTLPTEQRSKSNIANTKLHARSNNTFQAMNVAATGNWNGATLSAATAASSISATSSFLNSGGQPKGSSYSASNLSADNFPSLGPSAGLSRPNYSAANALAKRMSSKPNMSTDNFPALGGLARPPASLATLSHPSKPKAPPSFNSEAEFPAPPSSSQQRPKTRQSNVGSQGPSSLGVPTANAVATVGEMKVAMGSTAYKILKGFTKEFASGELNPESYIDHAATVFEKGYADDKFWSFIPTLVASCPDHYASAKAMRYMEHLKKMRNGAINAEAAHATTTERSWPGGPSAATNTAPPSSHTFSSTANARFSAPSPPPLPTAASVAGRYIPPPPPVSRLQTIPGKTKSAWGGTGGVSTVVRAKAPPGSVAVAAANAKPQIGTATKFMAKEMKLEAWTKANGSNSNIGSKGKKKKQNDELRRLAFGS